MEDEVLRPVPLPVSLKGKVSDYGDRICFYRIQGRVVYQEERGEFNLALCEVCRKLPHEAWCLSESLEQYPVCEKVMCKEVLYSAMVRELPVPMKLSKMNWRVLWRYLRLNTTFVYRLWYSH